jgi:general stress protein 26
MQGYEDVTLYKLTSEREGELLDKQVECTFIWTNKAGHGVGVIMNYVFHDGKIWLTATSQRARIKALRRDPRASIVISSTGTDMGAGKQATYKGEVIIHDDQETKDWFYPAMGDIISPYPAPTLEAAVEYLDTPLRVILEFRITDSILFDGDRLNQASEAGTVPTGD